MDAERTLLVGTTSSSATRARWAAQLTEELGVSWFTAFDNGGAKVLYDLATGTNGFYVRGWSEGLSAPAPSYAQWVVSFGLTGAQTAPAADADRDGDLGPPQQSITGYGEDLWLDMKNSIIR